MNFAYLLVIVVVIATGLNNCIVKNFAAVQSWFVYFMHLSLTMTRCLNSALCEMVKPFIGDKTMFDFTPENQCIKPTVVRNKELCEDGFPKVGRSRSIALFVIRLA